MSSIYKALYQLLICIAAVVMFVVTALRGLRDTAYRDRLPERFGFTRLRFVQSPIWIHAASVGEVQAAIPLIRRLLENFDRRPVLVTTTTPTGAARIKAVFAGKVQHAFLPYDTPGAVRRFLHRVQPHCLIIMETELWPDLLDACIATHVPVVLGSARISSRTANRYRYLRALFAPLLPRVSVGAQTTEDAQRYAMLGADPARMEVIGNIKYDVEISPDILSAGHEIRHGLLSRPVWIAGSTHAGEEEQILQAHSVVLSKRPETLLILVPRHPQRFAEVAALLMARKFNFVSRSTRQLPVAQHSVWLVDTVGELQSFYAASDVAFVGGSLVPVGGHNLLEPAALSLPVITGPHVFNAPDVARLLCERSALLQVSSGLELGERVTQLLASPDERTRTGLAALEVVHRNRGALSRLLVLIQQECRIKLS